MLRIPWRAAVQSGVRQLSTAAGLREIVDASPTTVMLLDENATIVHRSAGAERALKELLDNHGPELLTRMRSELTRQTLAATSFPIEFDVVVPGAGKTITTRCTVIRLSRGYLATYCDLTAHLAAGQATAGAAQDLTHTSRDLVDLGDRLAQGNSVAEQHAELVSAGAGELTSSIHEIAQSAARAAEEAHAVVTSTEQATHSIQRLRASGDEIGGIVRLIRMIAEQTKLLALNATIEAARAGASGRGFGVVADEVKTLAARTAEATEQVTAVIAAVQQETEETTAAVREIERLADSVAQMQAAIAGAVEEQRLTATDIGVAIDEMAESVTTAARTSAGLNELAAAVSESAERLSRRIVT
jgi:methyl-accepting chemotaxis protein